MNKFRGCISPFPEVELIINPKKQIELKWNQNENYSVQLVQM